MLSKFLGMVAKFQWFDYFVATYLVCYLIFTAVGIVMSLCWCWRKYVRKSVTATEEMQRDLGIMRGNDTAFICSVVAVFCIAILCRHL